jgi:hypothetical protein
MTAIRILLATFLPSFLVSGIPVFPAPPLKKLEISEENAGLLNKIGDYPELEVLSISCLEELTFLADTIGKLTKLKELQIDNGNGCAMNPALPESIRNLKSLEKLILYGAQDPRGPDEHSSRPKPAKGSQ